MKVNRQSETHDFVMTPASPPDTHLVSYGVAASVLRLCAEGHTTHQFGAGQGRDTVIIHGQNTQFVVPGGSQVTEQEVLVIGWNHPGREKKTKRDFLFQNFTLPCSQLSLSDVTVLVTQINNRVSHH